MPSCICSFALWTQHTNRIAISHSIEHKAMARSPNEKEADWRQRRQMDLEVSSEVLTLKQESRILGQWSNNTASGSRKSQASSPWAKHHRIYPVQLWERWCDPQAEGSWKRYRPRAFLAAWGPGRAYLICKLRRLDLGYVKWGKNCLSRMTLPALR